MSKCHDFFIEGGRQKLDWLNSVLPLCSSAMRAWNARNSHIDALDFCYETMLREIFNKSQGDPLRVTATMIKDAFDNPQNLPEKSNLTR